jgi:hypothetical protein
MTEERLCAGGCGAPEPYCDCPDGELIETCCECEGPLDDDAQANGWARCRLCRDADDVVWG